MKHILIVGKKMSSLSDYLLENGYEYTFLQDIKTTKFPDKKLKRRVLADFSSKEALLTSIDSLRQRPDALIATYENYVLPLAWIAEHLKLPGMPIQAAEACTDKALMRNLFLQSPEKISPDFAEVSNEADLLHFADTHEFPLILKPANLAKSLLVTKNDDREELLNNYRKAIAVIQDIYAKYAPNRQPKMIIEEFLEGSIHSVDAFVDESGEPHVLEQVVDYETGYDIGYDDNFHYSRNLPSKLRDEDKNALRNCARAGIRALGMKSSPAHVEIIMTTHGPRIVEIGARNGGYRERMHRLANGIDITANAIRTAFGEQPDLSSSKNNHCAVLELFPKQAGRFEHLAESEKLKKLQSLVYLSVKAKQGDPLGKASDGYKAAAIIILASDNKDILEADKAFIEEHCPIVTSI